MSCFDSADESAHYGFSVCMLLTQYRAQLRWDDGGVVELGSGDAAAIADVVAGMPGLRVRGHDISEPSIRRARQNIPTGASPTGTPWSWATSSTRPTPPAPE